MKNENGKHEVQEWIQQVLERRLKGGRIHDINRDTVGVAGIEGHVQNAEGWHLDVDEGVYWMAEIKVLDPVLDEVVFCKPSGSFWQIIRETTVTFGYWKPDNEDVFIYAAHRESTNQNAPYVPINGDQAHSGKTDWPNGSGANMWWIHEDGTAAATVVFYAL